MLLDKLIKNNTKELKLYFNIIFAAIELCSFILLFNILNDYQIIKKFHLMDYISYLIHKTGQTFELAILLPILIPMVWIIFYTKLEEYLNEKIALTHCILYIISSILLTIIMLYCYATGIDLLMGTIHLDLT